jgi:hypothetical protein
MGKNISPAERVLTLPASSPVAEQCQALLRQRLRGEITQEELTAQCLALDPNKGLDEWTMTDRIRTAEMAYEKAKQDEANEALLSELRFTISLWRARLVGFRYWESAKTLAQQTQDE